MSLLERQFPVFFNSDPKSGSTQIGTLGNRFQVQLQNPMSIPGNCVYATLEVVSAKVWNSTPNISEHIGNNHLHFSCKMPKIGVDPLPTTYGELKSYDVVFEDGLWDLDDMNAWLEYTFIRNELPKDLFVIVDNNSTQKVSIKMNYKHIVIDFTIPGSCLDVLGFWDEYNADTDTYTSTREIFSDLEGDSELALKDARFNRTEYYFISSNLTMEGIPVNNRATGVIAEIPINERVGSLINHIPTNPLRVDISDLIGQSKQNLIFSLTDQIGREISTAGEYWSLAMIVRYWGFEKPRA
jgi:hypothetical protein